MTSIVFAFVSLFGFFGAVISLSVIVDIVGLSTTDAEKVKIIKTLKIGE